MWVKPNKTVLRGVVRAIRPAADGWGADVDLEVEENDSPRSEEDFLKPDLGSTMTLFTAEHECLRVGGRVRVEARLNAGPTGGRPVIQSASPE